MLKRLSWLLLVFLILSLPLGQLGRISLGEEAGLYLSDFFAALIVFVWLINGLGRRRQIFLPSFWFPYFLFLLISIISLVNALRWLSTVEWLIAGSYCLRFTIYSLLAFVVFNLTREESSLRQKLISALIASGIILAAAGFIQLLILPDMQLLAETAGWDPHRNRLVSTFLDPNFTGAYLVFILSWVLSRSLPRSFSGKNFYLIVILSLALFLTFSRSAWLMFGIVIAVLGLFRARWLLGLALVVAFCAYFFVPRVQTRLSGITDPADSAHFRLISWQRTFEIIKDNPILGVGFNGFRYAQREKGYFSFANPIGGHAGAGSDSSFLLVWAMTGIFGLTAFFWLMFSLTATAWRTKNRPFSLAFLAIIAGLTVESTFINSIFYPPILVLFWMSSGLLEDA